MRFDVRWVLGAFLVAGCGGPTLGTPLPVPERSADLRDACPYVDLVPSPGGTLRALVREETELSNRVTFQRYSGGQWSRGDTTEYAFQLGHEVRDTAPGGSIVLAAADGEGAKQAIRYFDGSEWSAIPFDANVPRDSHQLWPVQSLVLSNGRILVAVMALPRDDALPQTYRPYLREATGVWTAVDDWQPALADYFAGSTRDLHRFTEEVSNRTLTRTVQTWTGMAWSPAGRSAVELPVGLPLIWPQDDAHGSFIVQEERSSDAQVVRVFAGVAGVWRTFEPLALDPDHRVQVLREPSGEFVAVRWSVGETPAEVAVHRTQGVSWVEVATYRNDEKVSVPGEAMVSGEELIVGWTETDFARPLELRKNCTVHLQRVEL